MIKDDGCHLVVAEYNDCSKANQAIQFEIAAATPGNY